MFSGRDGAFVIVDKRTLQNFLLELEAGDPVEQYRPMRQESPWREKLTVPQAVPRIYRGLYGDLRTVQPLLGIKVHSGDTFGTVQVPYVPLRYRLDVTPKVRHRHRADPWSIFPESAAYFSTPPLKGRRPDRGLWCILMMYAFTDEKHRQSFWINPLDKDWDLDTRSEIEYGQTFYVGHQPLPVTCAFVQIDKTKGTMKQRGKDAIDALCSLLRDETPRNEWRPQPRDPKAPPPKKHRLPKQFLRV